MNKIKGFTVLFFGLCLNACTTKPQAEPTVDDFPICQEETTLAVYDDSGAYQVPGCMDYAVPQIYGYAESSAEIEAMKKEMMVTVTDTTKNENQVQANQAQTDVKEEKTDKAKSKKKTRKRVKNDDFDVDKTEGEFPAIYNNKYVRNQVVLQNPQNRILAYCRGSDEEIAECVERLECAGYRRITEIPYLAAKYDYLKNGMYPSRRWRGDERIPRW